MDRIRKQLDKDTRYLESNYRNFPGDRERQRNGIRDVESEMRLRSNRRNDRDERYQRDEENNRDHHYRSDERERDFRNRERNESYEATLRNYHPRGGRRIEPSRREDTDWQSNPFPTRTGRDSDYNYDREARNYNRDDDYRWNNQGGRHSRFHRNDRGYRNDYDTDFNWQT